MRFFPEQPTPMMVAGPMPSQTPQMPTQVQQIQQLQQQQLQQLQQLQQQQLQQLQQQQQLWQGQAQIVPSPMQPSAMAARAMSPQMSPQIQVQQMTQQLNQILQLSQAQALNMRQALLQDYMQMYQGGMGDFGRPVL